jgi:Leucine-rich repeat (LRR) protein
MFDGSFTSISEFPGSWEKLTNLNTITLNNTAIRGSIDAISKLKKLKSIDFDRCYGIILPSQIGDLVGLSSLSVNSCGIAELPSSFKNLTLLETLDLSHNHLITYDITIFSNMTQLFSLSLEGNNSLHFPQLSNCSKLIKLNFSYNDIAEIHDEDIAGLINLEVLFIKSNRLKELPLKLL